MTREATLTLPAFDLVWSFGVEPDPQVPSNPPSAKLRYEVRAREEVFLSDKLWDYDSKAVRIPDPFGVYRFVHGMSLRLFFGQAPWPEGRSFRNVYKPLFSRVAAGGVHSRTVPLAVPIDEYSALERNIAAPTEEEVVARVTLVLDYRLRSEMKDDPKPPPFEDESVGYIVHDPQQLVSKLDTDDLPVKRRVEPIARIMLPSDQRPGRPQGL
jgi:hypothetical protein